MNSVLASPGVQWLARLSAIVIILLVQWWSSDPHRFIAHVQGRVERQSQSLQEAVRQTLALRIIQLSAPLVFFVSPRFHGSIVQGLALIILVLSMVAVAVVAQVRRPPRFLRRRWMTDLDEWWHRPGVAIRRQVDTSPEGPT